MTIWTRFTAWLSGWPEPKAKKQREEDYLFAEEEKMIRENNRNIGKKPKGLNPKKKAFWNHKNKN